MRKPFNTCEEMALLFEAAAEWCRLFPEDETARALDAALADLAGYARVAASDESPMEILGPIDVAFGLPLLLAARGGFPAIRFHRPAPSVRSGH